MTGRRLRSESTSQPSGYILPVDLSVIFACPRCQSGTWTGGSADWSGYLLRHGDTCVALCVAHSPMPIVTDSLPGTWDHSVEVLDFLSASAPSSTPTRPASSSTAPAEPATDPSGQSS